MIRGALEILSAYRRSRQIWIPENAGLGADRRVSSRVPAKFKCRLENPNFGLEAAGETIDLSLEGVALMTAVNWSEGNQIRLELEAPLFRAEGTIVYRREDPPVFRYGIKFRNLGVLQIVKLRQILKGFHKT